MSFEEVWPEVTLGDHVDLLTGYPFKSKEFSERPKDVPLVRGDNVAQGFLRWENAKRWDAAQYDDFAKFHLREGDVVLAMDRPWISAGLKYSWITTRDLPALLVQRVARMRGDNGLTTDYLRYLVGSPAFTDHVLSIITGVNVPHISGRDIQAFTFRLPPLSIQQRIAAILSAYDDLIDNNTRRITILEEMARRLYEEWFVHFRFPGHQDAEFDGDGGDRRPSGWELGLLSDYIELKYGKALKASERVEGSFPVYGSSGIVGSHNQSLVDGPGIIVGRKGNVGSVFWSDEPFYPIDTVYFVHTSLPLEYVYFNLQMQNFLNNDAAVPGLSRQQAYSLTFVKPADALLFRFVDVCQPTFAAHRMLRHKNANLRAQRDLLLPKLVSGEIDVSAAEAELEAAE